MGEGSSKKEQAAEIYRWGKIENVTSVDIVGNCPIIGLLEKNW